MVYEANEENKLTKKREIVQLFKFCFPCSVHKRAVASCIFVRAIHMDSCCLNTSLCTAVGATALDSFVEGEGEG